MKTLSIDFNTAADENAPHLLMNADGIVGRIHDDSDAKAIVHACNNHYALVEALQNVVNQWSYQFERNGHAAPEWAKDARAVLAAVGVRQPA